MDHSNPFPSVPEGSISYRDTKIHAQEVDLWLGLNTEETEAGLARLGALDPKHRLWASHPVQTILTPYIELQWMLNRLRPVCGSCVVELGAGYGRMGFVIARHFPEVTYLGYEIVQERSAEFEKAFGKFDPTAIERVKILRADLSDPAFSLPSAAYYFMYDYGHLSAIKKTLEDLKAISRTRPIAVVGRGRATRDQIERAEPWLSQVIAPENCGNFSIYRSGE